MIYPIVVYGHPVLRKVSEDIDENYPNLKQLINDMFDTLYMSEGVGLAAPQIGKSIRLFVIDATGMAEDDPTMKDFKKVFINAQITERFGEKEMYQEGCLSVPNLSEDVLRETSIRMEYYDENWKFHDETFGGMQARIIQHEYDHLDGILYVDRLSQLRKRLLKSKLTAIMKGDFESRYKVILPGQKIR